MKKLRQTTSVIAVWLVSLALAQGYLLENSFFDVEGINWGDGEGWEAFSYPGGGDAVGQHDWASGAPPADNGFYGEDGDGNFGLAFQAWDSQGGGFYQDVPVAPGEAYTFEIQSHLSCNAPGGVNYPTTSVFNIDFEWYDGDPEAGGIFVFTNANVIVPTDGGCDSDFPPGYAFPSNWEWWSYTHSAPTNASYLRVLVGWDGHGTNATGGDSEAVRWDNAFLTTDLEPLNQTVDPTDDLFAVSFNSQSTVTYRLESTADLDGWAPTVHPVVVGDETEHTLYDLPGDPMAAWRVSGSQPATELVNGDFEGVDTNDVLVGWNTWQGGGWVNREINSKLSTGTYTAVNSGLILNGVYDNSHQLALGGYTYEPGGAYQVIFASPGVDYTVQVQCGVDDWWLPTGEIRLIFLDLADAELAYHVAYTTDSIHSPDLYDWGVPFTNWSLTATAPAGTAKVKVELAETAGTGSVWFDNVVFTNNNASGPPPPLVPNDVALGQTNSVFISFDGQTGVRYQLQYSEDGGTTWFDTLHPIVVGDGTRQSAYDPEGPSGIRTYQLQVVPEALPPEP